jgi:hypothetical protein
MKRCLAGAVAACAVVLVLAGPALAATPAPVNPSQACGPDDIYVREILWRGQTIHRELPIGTHGGCASSWATGAFSVAAVTAQCKRLEAGVVLNGQPFTLTYPHVFYGIWPAKNRGGCIAVLHGLATGELDADVLPFPV